MKRVLYIALVLAIVFSLGACTDDSDGYLSGVSFDPVDYGIYRYETYKNKLYSFSFDYPENFEREGNFDIDGYIVFKGRDIAISAYVPDTENNGILTAERYAKEVLKLGDEGEAEIVKYGKTGGYKTVQYDDEGNVRIDFIAKGVGAFYRFAYTTVADDFDEENEVFQTVMRSIRIEDGEYDTLVSMAEHYEVILEYATSMQYITDANYANHCLNNYEQLKRESYKDEALSTCVMIREEISKIIEHEREEDEKFETMWQEIITAAEEIAAACEDAETCIEEGDYAGAQKIARTRFSYELSEHASNFIQIINAEIAEY